MSKKIFKDKFRVGQDVVNIGWQHNVEKEFPTKGLIQFGYISGYKDAADSLIDQVRGTSLADSYVFPIVFLYRQYLELVLKNLYVTKYGKDIEMDHGLTKLWEKVKKRIKEETTKENREFIDLVIKEFRQVDPGSVNFRYFWKKDYSPTLPSEMSVDLVLMKERIDKVDTILYFSYGV